MDNNEPVKSQENGGIIIMKEDYFRNLPSEIIIDILSRLLIRTIITCKVVCKSWCNFITSLEFANSHQSRSIPGLAVSQKLDLRYKFFEFVDDIDPYFHGISFRFPHDVEIRCSVDGLLALGNGGMCHYICNPVTREYIKLPLPPSPSEIDLIGFGVSKITRQYKLVRIAHKSPKCEVYTLGTGSWRSIGAHPPTGNYNTYNDQLVFLKGVLHCLVLYPDDCFGITCFDLETELFSTFSIPSLDIHGIFASLITLRDCLCLCHYSFDFGEIDIWSMKEYGEDRHWTKEFVVKNRKKIPLFITDLRVLIDGDILMADKYGAELVRFSPKANTIRTTRLSGLDAGAMVFHTIKVVYTPSFLPVLRTLVMEDVTIF